MSIESLIKARLSIKEINFARESKLLNFDGAKQFVEIARKLGKTVVLDEGTWDLTHPDTYNIYEVQENMATYFYSDWLLQNTHGFTKVKTDQ